MTGQYQIFWFHKTMRTKFFTGEGDKGESRVGVKKVLKSDPLVGLLGSLDELNSFLGLCGVEAKKFSSENINVVQSLGKLQQFLFVAQAEVATLIFGEKPNGPKGPKINAEKTKFTEEIIKKVDESVPKIDKFVIVGGSELSARLDFARALARTVERKAKILDDEKPLPVEFLRFLNRLSSVLFALARYVNFELGIKEENPSYD